MSILTPAQLQRVRKFQTGGDASNYISAVQQNTQQMDPITQQLLFGLDGQGGFIPGAFRAAERTFFDDQGRPIVIPQEIAGLSPDQIRAQELARANVGTQQPFITQAMERGQQGIDALQAGFAGQDLAAQQALQQTQEGARFALDQRDRALQDSMRGIQEGRGRAITAEERLRGDLGDITGVAQQGVGQFAEQLGQQAAQTRRATEDFGMDLARARQQGRKTYDEFGRDITDAVGMGMRSAEDLSRGLSRSEELAARSGATQRARLDLAEQGLKGGISRLDRDLTRQLGAEAQTTGDFGSQLGEARTELQKTTARAHGHRVPRPQSTLTLTRIRVVQQAITDASEGLAKQDMAQYARDIASGGESAFGSRARLSADRSEPKPWAVVWPNKLADCAQQAFNALSRRLLGEDERQQVRLKQGGIVRFGVFGGTRACWRARLD